MTTEKQTTENRTTFIERCEVLFPHEDVVLITGAYDLFKGHHANQERKDERNADGTPVRYFEHVRRVPLIVMDETPALATPATVIMGLGHDAYEDTHLGHEVLARFFGPEISRGILLMSKRPKQGFVKRLLSFGAWGVLAVKVADRIDNLRHLTLSTPEFRAKQVAETRAIYYGIAQHLVEKTRVLPDEFYTAAQDLSRILREECDKAAAI